MGDDHRTLEALEGALLAAGVVVDVDVDADVDVAEEGEGDRDHMELPPEP